MDELLALMDEDDANRQRQQQQQQQQDEEEKTNATFTSHQENDDEDPLADFIGADSAFQEEINTTSLRKLSKSSSAQTNSNHSQKTTSSNHKKPRTAKNHLPPPQNSNLATAGIDSRLGIRMIQRHMSSVELTEFLSLHEQSYHSPAALAAMSLRQRNQLLVDPVAQVVDASTVTGATTLATVGLVLYHSGTRLSSSNGNAFCVIHIGSFAAGACCSVLLFGTAYSQQCQTLVPGQVALLCHPKLMAPNNNHKNDTTTITLSCSEASQIQRIATARDYGTCAFTGIPCRQTNGQWSNSGHCRQFIDKRCGAYCAKHKQHAKNSTTNSSTVGTKRNSLSKLNQMRQEQLSLRSVIPLPQQPQKKMTQHSSAAGAAGNNRFLNPGVAGNISVVASSGLASRGVPRQMTKQPPQPPQRAAVPPSGRPNNSNRFLLRPSSAKTSTTTTTTKTVPLPILSTNPYAKQKSTKTTTAAAKVTPVPPPPSTKRRNNHNTTDLLGSSLQQKKSSSHHNHKSRKRLLNTKSSTPAVGVVEGSVLVPAPSKLLFGSSNTSTNTSSSSKVLIPPQRPLNHSQEDEERNKILTQQRQYAERLKKQGQSSQSSNNKKIKTSHGGGTALQQHHKNSSKSRTETQRQDFFHSLPAVDLDKVKTQKSRFQHEAEAEQYAKSRQALLELEQVEERSSSKTNPQQQAASKKLSNEWHCKTCNRVFTKRPNVCHVKGHVLTIQRKLLKHPVSKTDQRTKLNETSAEDGGLRLGAGLDWSRWGQFH